MTILMLDQAIMPLESTTIMKVEVSQHGPSYAIEFSSQGKSTLMFFDKSYEQIKFFDDLKERISQAIACDSKVLVVSKNAPPQPSASPANLGL